jgi:hypothetical protein
VSSQFFLFFFTPALVTQSVLLYSYFRLNFQGIVYLISLLCPATLLIILKVMFLCLCTFRIL